MIIDADLYSSTSCVLGRLRNEMPVGTLIYFDEFNDRFHELKAFDEFLTEAGMEFRLLRREAAR